MRNIFLLANADVFLLTDIAAFLLVLIGMFFLSLALINKKQTAYITLFFLTHLILFGSRILCQTNNFYPLAIFIFGCIFIVLEIFIPGFTVTGVIGILGYLTSINLAFSDYKYGLLAIIISLNLNIAFLRFMFKKGYTLKGLTHFVLSTQSNLKENKEEINELEKLIGKEAKSISSLGPTGFVLVDEVKYNAISYDGYLDNNLDLKVIAVKGRYLIVDKEVK
ncbi:NfeD family protein [Fenollaria massiliensis]|uniref:NfeD family protein n=1 Tax=Fenollaria massiliensis TaxID=938288 RepID=UPI00037C8BFA|nr:NfeD family protein [Fenollaria massiliensis]